MTKTAASRGFFYGDGFLANRGVDGYAVHAVMVSGADVVPDDLAANHHRVGGKPPTPLISPGSWL